MLDSLIAPYENAVQLLCTIPGVDRNSAITVISEIGIDMAPFSSSKRLCCWAGLTPGNNESAGKKKSARITCAIIAIARMILTSIYHMLSTGETWNPTDLYKVDIPESLKEKQKEKAIKQAKKLLISEEIISEYHLAS